MKKLLLLAVAVIGFAALAHAGGETAANCTYTGSDSDYCSASDGTNNYHILDCKPGSTDCGYN